MTPIIEDDANREKNRNKEAKPHNQEEEPHTQEEEPRHQKAERRHQKAEPHHQKAKPHHQEEPHNQEKEPCKKQKVQPERFVCVLCDDGHSFTRRNDLKRHHNRFHDGEELKLEAAHSNKSKCLEYGQCFHHLLELKKHLAFVHEKTFRM